MDVAGLTAFLVPFLPFLLKAGEGAAEQASEQFGAETWSQANAIWSKLQPHVEAKAAAQEAVQDVAQNPEEDDLKIVLRVQLRKLLEQDPDLATAIAQMMPANLPSSPAAPQNTPLPVKLILVLAANPKATSVLRLAEAVRKLQTGLARSQNRDRFRIEQRWATTPMDVRRALLDCQPQIVHFIGHGLGDAASTYDPNTPRKAILVDKPTPAPEGLMLEDETGQAQLVSAVAIASLFQAFSAHIEFVMLNACYSETQARAIAQHIPAVVGMKRAIGDAAAIVYAVSVYDAILAGRSVDFAHQLGCSALLLEGTPAHLPPTLYLQHP